MSKGVKVGTSRVAIGGSAIKLRHTLPRVATIGSSLVTAETGVINPYGFHNLEFDHGSAVIQHWDDYYETQAAAVKSAIRSELRGNKRMGANVHRVQLQMFQYITGADENSLSVRTTQMANLIYQVDQARQAGLYMILCGCNVGVPDDAPAWYEALPYADRWDVQEYFWTQLVQAVVDSGNATTVMAYDLINEPYISADPTADIFAGNYGSQGVYYNQCVAEGASVDDDTVRDWITQERDAIKAVDPDALVTCGVLPFPSGAFGYANTQDLLDFCQPHFYPTSDRFPGDIDDTLGYISSWASATVPVVCGEWQAVSETASENVDTIAAIFTYLGGLISYSYGYPPAAFAPQPHPVVYPAIGANDQYYAKDKASLELMLTYDSGDF
ncbi:MAG: hypothetical protein CME59_02205 [Halioglobus sp.]|nr:hypothetical protein [Halioglobus sp.]|tara:strand:- start:3474 stop:4628 length:1155 start_codon:yes stop_codon:yes gene_type:complete